MSIFATLLVLAVAQDGSRTVEDMERGMQKGELCGVDATDGARLLAKLRQDPDVEPFGEQGDVAQLMDRKNSLIWTIPLPGKRFYPAVSCSEFGPHNGKLALRQSVNCNSLAQEDCGLFFAINRRRNDDVLAILAEDEPKSGN